MSDSNAEGKKKHSHRKAKVSGQPNSGTSSAPGSSGMGSSGTGSSGTSSGTATSGTATSGPGVLSRPFDNTQPEPKPQLDAGTPSPDEQQSINALVPGENPRHAIKNFAETINTNGEPAYFLQSAHIIFLNNEVLRKQFPATLFYVLRFPQWPLARMVPEPLQNNNVFAFTKGQPLQLITKADSLTDFFKGHLPPIKSAEAGHHAIKAWLLLDEELVQDGMFKFKIVESAITAQKENGDLVCGGKAVVEPDGGNGGQITAKLLFDAEGRLQDVTQNAELRAGMRPICQSTKLLDPDPIVRKMAEQDLLIMGKACKPYLDEQRPKLSPELRGAVDKIWRKIELEDRYARETSTEE